MLGKEWVYGGYTVVNMGLDMYGCIVERGKESATPIVLHTLGEYTGIKDINDIEIYEGDIVTTDSEYDGIITNVVSWYRGGFTVGGHTFRELYNIEVVGNIHDKNYLSKGVNKNEND